MPSPTHNPPRKVTHVPSCQVGPLTAPVLPIFQFQFQFPSPPSSVHSSHLASTPFWQSTPKIPIEHAAAAFLSTALLSQVPKSTHPPSPTHHHTHSPISIQSSIPPCFGLVVPSPPPPPPRRSSRAGPVYYTLFYFCSPCSFSKTELPILQLDCFLLGFSFLTKYQARNPSPVAPHSSSEVQLERILLPPAFARPGSTTVGSQHPFKVSSLQSPVSNGASSALLFSNPHLLSCFLP